MYKFTKEKAGCASQHGSERRNVKIHKERASAMEQIAIGQIQAGVAAAYRLSGYAGRTAAAHFSALI